MLICNRQKPLQVFRASGPPLHREKIDDLNEQQRLTAARFFHRLNQLAQSGNKAIVADAQQWTTRNIAHARRLNNEHTRASFRKTSIPVEVLLRHKTIFSRTPRHHRRHPRATTRFEPPDLNRTKQTRARRFISVRPASFFYL